MGMNKIRKAMIFMTLMVAMLVMPSYVFAADCTAVGTESDLRACLEAGKSVTLTTDVEVVGRSLTSPTTNRTVGINIEGKDTIIINGNGHKIYTETNQVLFEVRATQENTTVKFRDVIIDVSNQAYPRAIDTRSNNLNLELEKVTLTASGTGNPQGITIGGSVGPVSLAIKDSSIDVSTAGYGVITYNPVKNLAINDSVISGYAALYMKGVDNSQGSKGSVVNITGSKMIGSGNHSGESNNFSTIFLMDDNITINVVNSDIIAKNVGDAIQSPIGISATVQPTTKPIINISGESSLIVDIQNTKKDVAFNGGKLNIVISSGVKSNVDIKEDYLEQGAKLIKTENGVIVAKEYPITIVESEEGKITVDKANAYAGDIVTITVTPNEGYKIKMFGVKTIEGAEVKVTDGKFEMPNFEVVVGATFEKLESLVENPDTSDINLIPVVIALIASVTGLWYTIKKRYN